MKCIRPFLKMIIAATVMSFPLWGEGTRNSGGILMLQNGDQISSGITQVGPEGFKVQFPWAEHPFTIRFADVKWYVRPDLSLPSFHEGVVLSLTSGNQISGTELTFQSGVWAFTTHWGQTISVHPDEIQRIRFYPEGRLKVSGPSTGEEDRYKWVRRVSGSKQSPSFPILGGRVMLNGRYTTLQLPSAPLPDPFLVEFDYHFAKEPFHTRFALFENSQGFRSGRLTITLMPKRITTTWIQMDEKKAHIRRSKNWAERITYKRGPQMLRVMGGSQKGKLYFNLDGMVQKEFPFPALKQEKFFEQLSLSVQQGSMDSVIISGVRVVAFDKAFMLPTGLPPKGKSRLITYDGQIEVGEVLAVTEAHVEWRKEGEVSSVLVPRTEVFEITYHPGKEAKKIEGEFAASLLYTGLAGDRFPIEVLRLEDEVLVSRTPLSPDLLRIPFAFIQFWKMDPDGKQVPAP